MQNTSAIPTTPHFAGWARTPRGRWRCLVTGCDDPDEAQRWLREKVAGQKFVDLCVLPEGRTPNRKGDKK